MAKQLNRSQDSFVSDDSDPTTDTDSSDNDNEDTPNTFAQESNAFSPPTTTYSHTLNRNYSFPHSNSTYSSLSTLASSTGSLVNNNTNTTTSTTTSTATTEKEKDGYASDSEIDFGVLIAEFSQLTGEDDQIRILSILDKHNYNLETSVSYYLDEQDARHYYTPTFNSALPNSTFTNTGPTYNNTNSTSTTTNNDYSTYYNNNVGLTSHPSRFSMSNFSRTSSYADRQGYTSNYPADDDESDDDDEFASSQNPARGGASVVPKIIDDTPDDAASTYANPDTRQDVSDDSDESDDERDTAYIKSMGFTSKNTIHNYRPAATTTASRYNLAASTSTNFPSHFNTSYPSTYHTSFPTAYPSSTYSPSTIDDHIEGQSRPLRTSLTNSSSSLLQRTDIDTNDNDTDDDDSNDNNAYDDAQHYNENEQRRETATITNYDQDADTESNTEYYSDNNKYDGEQTTQTHGFMDSYTSFNNYKNKYSDHNYSIPSHFTQTQTRTQTQTQTAPSVDYAHNLGYNTRYYCQLQAPIGEVATLTRGRASLKLLCVDKLSGCIITHEKLIELLRLCDSVDVYAFHQLVFATAARHYYTIRYLPSYNTLSISTQLKVKDYM